MHGKSRREKDFFYQKHKSDQKHKRDYAICGVYDSALTDEDKRVPNNYLAGGLCRKLPIEIGSLCEVGTTFDGENCTPNYDSNSAQLTDGVIKGKIGGLTDGTFLSEGVCKPKYDTSSVQLVDGTIEANIRSCGKGTYLDGTQCRPTRYWTDLYHNETCGINCENAKNKRECCFRKDCEINGLNYGKELSVGDGYFYGLCKHRLDA